ncbi:hypothetical protein G3O00_00385 [Burkholderia sp. Ac-20384]|uniref:hypothetical protein n=1 Tax=Burkholderia sp. Ac-20384 TaxID=2703902 RepID=UPI001980984E|nr:hypothetical protein [Burkholderia sp. Ac-20384]MBN3822075.1 hypothetical protein [Burkholderia sp. Ac-20384]
MIHAHTSDAYNSIASRRATNSAKLPVCSSIVPALSLRPVIQSATAISNASAANSTAARFQREKRKGTISRMPVRGEVPSIRDGGHSAPFYTGCGGLPRASVTTCRYMLPASPRPRPAQPMADFRWILAQR